MGSCPSDVKAARYRTLVRPQVEYGLTVWDPNASKNIKPWKWSNAEALDLFAIIIVKAVALVK